MPGPHSPTICGGRLRGRRLEVPPGLTTRPTRSLVRQALFNMISAEVPGAIVLDLYSGSGALGLEALSRGAASVVFLESDRAALAALRRNIVACQLAPGLATLLGQDVLRYQGSGREAFTLVLADPPFRLLDALPPGLGTPGVLDPAATLVWHAPSERPAPRPVGWQLEKSRQHGRSGLHIYRRAGA